MNFLRNLFFVAWGKNLAENNVPFIDRNYIFPFIFHFQEYKNTLEDLEAELNSQQQQINSLSTQNKTLELKVEKVDILTTEIHLLKDENSELNNKYNELENNMNSSQQLKGSQEEVQQQNDDELFILARTLDDLDQRYKQLEDEMCVKNKIINDLEIMLSNQNNDDQSEVDILCKSLGIREDEYMKLEEEYKKSQEEVISLQKVV